MKILLATAAMAVLAIAASPAAAADSSSVNWYTNLGYSDAQFSDGNLSAVTGRIGVRNMHIGLEAEASTGLGSTDVSGISVKMRDAYAADVIVFAPVSPNAELFARAGYGRIDLNASAGGFSGTGGSSGWNAGVGGQWFPKGGSNGLRADYTYTGVSGGHYNDYGISWVHRF